MVFLRGFFLITFFVILAGGLALLIRLIWAVPLSSLAYAFVYRDVFGIESVE